MDLVTSKELIDDLRALGPQDLNVVLRYLADRVPAARTADGLRILDASDFIQWLRELAQCWRVSEQLRPPSAALKRVCDRLAGFNTCPRCGHIHQGESECGQEMGGGGFCRCELNVLA